MTILELLKSLEWRNTYRTDFGSYVQSCPICEGVAPGSEALFFETNVVVNHGHRSNCELAEGILKESLCI